MFEINTWFSSWDRLADIAFGGLYFFVFIVLLVRILGKRVTSQMNNFDWIISVAVGSLAASGVLLENVTLLDATAAILVLAFCQWFVTWAVIRFPFLSKLFKPTPRLLLHKGEFLKDAMLKERISEAEIKAKLRQKGYTTPEEANWVIIETDGSMTVIPRQEVDVPEADLLSQVANPPRLENS